MHMTSQRLSMKIILTFFSFLLLLNESWSIERCSSSIGSSTELSFLGIIDFEEEIYINVASATTCGGYLRNVSYCAIKRGTGAPFNNGIIFLMEPSGNNRYEVVQSSMFSVQEEHDENGCSEEYQTEYIVDIDGVPSENDDIPTVTALECKWHCYNDSIFLEDGSVLGYQPTQKNLRRGQIIVENTYGGVGLCQATVVQYDANEIDTVECAVFNTTRTILANASIDVVDDCAVLPPPQYGSVNVTTLAVGIGDSVEYTCDSGYELEGASILTCQEQDGTSGQWSTMAPQCNSDINIRGLIVLAVFVFVALLICALVTCVLVLARRVYKSRKVSLYSDNMLTASVNRMAAPLNGSPGHTLRTDDTEMRTNTRASTKADFKQDFDDTCAYSYVTTTKISQSLAYASHDDPPPLPPLHPSITDDHDVDLHYETSSQFVAEEDSESPYWMPADVEKEIYIQLETIKVKSIQSCDLNIREALGSGQFSIVNKAEWFNDNTSTEVAVKQLKLTDSESKVKLLQEAATMGQFSHSNVLKLHGIVTDSVTLLLVVECMSKGDLLSLLTKIRRQASGKVSHDTKLNLLNYCRQICLGMTYLSNKGFIHRDLAARNILVSGDDICKIADFGMSRDVCEDDYYLAREGQPIPLKWTAPESLNYRKYSTASDVWSYGCLLYEIWSLGQKPYAGMSTTDTIKTIKTGKRLSPPPGCPKIFYMIMMNCWNPDHTQRSNFHDIMLLLLQKDEEMLAIPEEDSSTHPNAGDVGASLTAGRNMYQDLQNKYIKSNTQ